MADLDTAYETCRRLHRRHDPTYYWATRRLPRAIRPATHALYAYVRVADDIVDGTDRDPDPQTKRAQLDAWEAELQRALQGDTDTDPIVQALADAGRRHDLPLGELERYMRSMRIDCDAVRMATYDDLEDYMHGSAGSVGRIMCGLLGARDESRADFGRLALAFQLTNFLRDVREDRTLDRIYLPADDRLRFGVREDELAAPRASPALRALIAFEVVRARELFESSAPAIAAARPGVRSGIRLACVVYQRVLNQIEDVGHDVLGARTAPAPWKLGGAVGAALMGRAA